MIVGPLVTLVDTGFAVTIERHAHFLLLGRLPFVPQVVVAGLILVGIDAMNWLAHFNNHRSAAFWRLHALHHSQEDMSVFTTFRTHPLAHASYLPALIPALLPGRQWVGPDCGADRLRLPRDPPPRQPGLDVRTVWPESS